MLMPDPAAGLHDLEQLLDLPCQEWGQPMAERGIDLDCVGIADGQSALRQALAGGGTYHDVIGRLRRALEASALPSHRRVIALAVADVARAAPRRRLALALGQLGGAAAAAC